MSIGYLDFKTPATVYQAEFNRIASKPRFEIPQNNSRLNEF